jgi:hypothetical protein
VIRDLTGLFAALGYALDSFGRVAGSSAEPQPLPPAELLEDEVDESELIVIAEIFERLGDRYLDEVRGWDALNGVLLGGIFALFVLFVDKAESFTWIPSVLLVVPAGLTAWNLRGSVEYAPDPDAFQAAYEEDSANALANLIQNHKDNATANGVLRNRKRAGFYLALIVLVGVCLVAAAGKRYTQLQEPHETKQAAPQGRLLAGAPRGRGDRPGRREDRFPAAAPQGKPNARTPRDVQLQPLRRPQSGHRQRAPLEISSACRRDLGK